MGHIAMESSENVTTSPSFKVDFRKHVSVVACDSADKIICILMLPMFAIIKY